MYKFYLDAKEDIGEHPEPRDKGIKSSIWFDPDHTHDTTTSKLITGLTVYLSETLIKSSSHRQGDIE